MGIWIDFDSLPATNTGAIIKEGDTDTEAALLIKNPKKWKSLIQMMMTQWESHPGLTPHRVS